MPKIYRCHRCRCETYFPVWNGVDGRKLTYPQCKDCVERAIRCGESWPRGKPGPDAMLRAYHGEMFRTGELSLVGPPLRPAEHKIHKSSRRAVNKKRVK